MKKRILAIYYLICLTAFGVLISFLPSIQNSATTFLSNADVMPKYITNRNIGLEPSDIEDGLMTPEWFKSAIMVEVRLETATPEGTIEASVKMLDHYQEMGVNCLWITPVFHKGKTLADPNGYTSYGPHTIDPSLTGTDDYEKGWEVFGWFVYEAHKRNIRILLDFVTWGVDNESTLIKSNPELFSGKSTWGGAAYDYESEDFLSWYKNNALKVIKKTNIDGMRCDVEPNYTGYDMYKDIRKRALEQGNKIVLMGEVPNERFGTYDAEQFGVMSYDGWDYAQQFADPKDFYLGWYNIVDSVKTGNAIGSKLSQLLSEGGTYRFYTYNLSNHDFAWTTFNNNLIRVGYQAIFAPFIPLWYMGEEVGSVVKNQTLYYAGKLDLNLLQNQENRYFYEKLKKYIRIRRQFPDIFNYFPINHQDSNICKVNVGGLESLQSYARYDSNGNGIIIVPNVNIQNPTGDMTVLVPFADMNMKNFKNYTVTDLISGEKITSGNKTTAGVFNVNVAPNEIGVYLIQGSGPIKIANTSNSQDIFTEPDLTDSESASGDISITDSIIENTSDIKSISTNASKATSTSENITQSTGIKTSTFIAVIVLFMVLISLGLAAIIILKRRNSIKK